MIKHVNQIDKKYLIRISAYTPIFFIGVCGGGGRILYRSLPKHTYSNILKILQLKKENLQIKKSDIFHISAQNIYCGYSLDIIILKSML